jgi:RNA polymerase sigma-70 factor (ECF subfamily)
MPDAPNAAPEFTEEALPHFDSLYRMALRLTQDVTRAEDLVQETLLKAFRAWGSYRPGTNARAWLLTILRNTFINEYRRSKREPVATDLEAVEPFFDRIVDARVLEAIDRLPTEFREVLALSDMEGLSYAEIAESLDIPIGTVKSRLFRARRQLQHDLYEHAVEMGYIRPREDA